VTFSTPTGNFTNYGPNPGLLVKLRFFANKTIVTVAGRMIDSRTMRQVGMFFPLLLVLAQLPVRGSAQAASIENAIQSPRNDIEVSDGHLLGPGAAKIRDATSHTCYAFLGEDHGIREVPEFADALTGVVVGDGVQTLALEVSPSVARQLSLQLASPNPSQSFASFLRQFPLTVPFYNTAEEFDFLRHAKARIGTSFSLIGFDQGS